MHKVEINYSNKHSDKDQTVHIYIFPYSVYTASHATDRKINTVLAGYACVIV